MQCDVTQQELVSFYFADLDESTRTRVESHLRECGSCLNAYLSLKRSIEAAEFKPSEEARMRLRDAVAQELATAGPAPWLWWERPLAVAFATTAVALIALTVSQL